LPEPRQSQPLLKLVLAMLSEGCCSLAGQPDVAPLAALRSLEFAPATGLGERAAHLKHPSFEVYVFPLEPLQLATPKTGGNGHDVQSLEPVAGVPLAAISGLEESLDLLAVEGPYLFSPGLRRSGE
jgi:hypothetical protein